MQLSNSATLESLESRYLLTGSALVQPLADVEYFGDVRDWALNAVQAPEVWAHGHRGDGVVVAVIDSGIQLQHAELVDRIWSNPDEIPGNGLDDDGNGYVDDVRGWDFVGDDAIAADEAGHGTKVAGVLVAARNDEGATGIAYEAQIMPLRVLDSQGRGSQYDIASAIRYAVDNGADVINLSVGATTGSQRLRLAIEHALDHEVLIVAASGNAAESHPDYPASYSRDLSNVLSVGAYDKQLELASFSNRVGTSGSVQLDAPGVSVYSTGLDTPVRYGSGTSFATPLVTGVAALVLSAAPDLSATELRTILVESANISVSGSDSIGGVNAALAVASVETQSPGPAPFLPGDTDDDGVVGMSDFLAVSRNFNTAVGTRIGGDLNADGRVDFKDFLILTRNYGNTTAAAVAQQVAAVDEVHARQLDFDADHLLDELIS